MIELTGINLGERHHELNKKVHEAFTNNESFEQICKHEEKSDVDRLFKIDLANLHKDVNYLEETLKCGDPLYISRALKCSCLFEAEHIINPDYVHNNIFPLMSAKMKRKMLNAIAVYVQEQERINSFYEYCVSHRLNTIAFKFLIYASQYYKEEYLKSNIHIADSIKYEFFFGNSNELIQKHIQRKKLLNFNLVDDLFRFSYLYSSSSNEYLDLLECCLGDQECIYNRREKRFGLRMSKDIMIKHKSRVFDKLWLYLGILNKQMIAKYSSQEDVKKYAIALMPETAERFWSINFYKSFDYFLDKIPANQLYSFLKETFLSKYPGEIFEMNFSFYRLNLHEFMTVDERHEWALKHIEQKKEHFGPLRDYLWYEFVKFNKAFFEIKKYIYVNKSADIRSELLYVLIKSASSQEDLETLVTYYYERHVNEVQYHKESFIRHIVNEHNVYKFDEKVWTVFNKLLHSLDIFNTTYSDRLVMLALVYNIIHYKLIPQYLEPFCKFEGSFSLDLGKLDSEQKEFLYTYLKDYFVIKIKELMGETNTDDIKERLILFSWSMIRLIDGFKKPQEECPEVAMISIKLHWDRFQHHHWFKSERNQTEGDLLRLLKKDKDLLLEEFPTAKKYDIICTNLLKKVKIYFYNDLAKSMTEFFEKKLLELYKDENNYCSFDPIVFNLVQLADTKFKLNLMTEYAPITPKIKHDEIDRNLLRIQEAICRFVHYSRPPVPLSNIQQYIKGDYVSFCLPMFNSYLVNLPLPLSLEFTKALLDAPVSIQKHGLRLAFQSYEADRLKELIINVWKSTQNVSLRLVIYKAVIDKIKNVNEYEQIQLYEALKMFTLDLGITDQDEIFDLLTSSNLPEKFYGDFLVAAWTSVNKLPFDSSAYINRKYELIQYIASNIKKVNRDFCRDIIDDHIDTMFEKRHIIQYDNTYGISRLYSGKWSFTAIYITHFNSEEELKSSLELLQKIMKSCYDIWNILQNENYVVRGFLYEFLYTIENNTAYKHNIEKKPAINPVFESIVRFFQEFLPINKIIIMNFKLEILCRNALGDGLYDTENKIITYNHLVNENVAKYIAKGIVDLVTEQYYPSLCSHIAELIRDKVSSVTQCTNLKSEQLVVAVSRNLSEYNQNIVHMLVLHILPLNICMENENVFYATIDKIMTSNNEDLNSFIYHKFIRDGFSNRLARRM